WHTPQYRISICTSCVRGSRRCKVCGAIEPEVFCAANAFAANVFGFWPSLAVCCAVSVIGKYLSQYVGLNVVLDLVRCNQPLGGFTAGIPVYLIPRGACRAKSTRLAFS